MSTTTYRPRIYRAWINQPSTLQPAHKYHGRRVLADHNSIVTCSDRVVNAGTKIIDVYFVDGDAIMTSVPLLAISPGWPP